MAKSNLVMTIVSLLVTSTVFAQEPSALPSLSQINFHFSQHDRSTNRSRRHKFRRRVKPRLSEKEQQEQRRQRAKLRIQKLIVELPKLRGVKKRSAKNELARFLKDKSPAVRIFAINQMSNAGRIKLEQLQSVFGRYSEDPGVTIAATHALLKFKISDDQAKAVIKWLQTVNYWHPLDPKAKKTDRGTVVFNAMQTLVTRHKIKGVTYKQLKRVNITGIRTAKPWRKLGDKDQYNSGSNLSNSHLSKTPHDPQKGDRVEFKNTLTGKTKKVDVVDRNGNTITVKDPDTGETKTVTLPPGSGN